MSANTGHYPVDEIFHFGLQSPPSEFDSYQFVRAHVWTVCLGLTLHKKKHIFMD